MADAGTHFDPGEYFAFDLNAGAVTAKHGGRVLIVSDNVIAPLVSAAVSNGDLTSVRQLGREFGESVAASLPASADSLGAEVVLSHAAGALAVFGWGRLSVQRWGDALVAELEQIPTLDDEHLGVAALLGGLLSALAGTEVACVPVDRRGVFLVVDPGVAQQVWKWARGGADIATMVGRLWNPAEGSA